MCFDFGVCVYVCVALGVVGVCMQVKVCLLCNNCCQVGETLGCGCVGICVCWDGIYAFESPRIKNG